MKHGVIALVDKGTPVFIISSDDDNHENMLSAAAEVKARGAWVIGVGQSDNELFDDFIPTIQSDGIDALTNVIPVSYTHLDTAYLEDYKFPDIIKVTLLALIKDCLLYTSRCV